MADLDLTLAVKVSSPELRQLVGELERMGIISNRGMENVGRGAQDASRGIEGMGRQLRFVQNLLEGFVLYRGFRLLTNQATDFIRTMAELQHELGLVQAQLGGVGGDFRPQIQENIIRIGRETGQSFTALAKAEFEVVSANIEVAQSFRILELSAKAAVAGGLKETELAFAAALSQVNAFNLSNEEFGAVFDKQFQLVRRGIFTYQQFATVVGTVAEAFASMGQDVDTANASLAAISQVFTGRQLERGATALRNAVLRIGEAKDDFEALGVAVTDANGDFRNFLDIGRDLERLLAGLSEAERFAVVRNLFPDERERRGIEAFLDNLDRAEEFFVEQKFAAGSLERAYETVSESLLKQADIFKNNLVPAAQPLITILDSGLTTINEWNESLPGLSQNLIQLSTALLAVGAAQRFGGGLMARSVPIGAGPIGRLGITPLGGAFAAGSLLMSGAAGAQPGFNPIDLAGSVLGGAAVGAGIGVPWGALVGGVASAMAFGIGQSFEKEAPPIAKSFADEFSAALKANSGSVAVAFSTAVLNQSKVINTPLLDALRTGIPERLSEEIIGPREIGYRRLIPAMSPEVVETRLRSAFATASRQMRELEPFRDTAHFRDAQLVIVREAAERTFGPNSELSDSLTNLIIDFVDAGKSSEDFGVALKSLADKDMPGFLGALRVASSELQKTSLELERIRIESLVSGEVDDAIGVFEHLGVAGMELATAFLEIKRSSEAISLAQSIFSIQVSRTRQVPLTYEEAREQAMQEFLAQGGGRPNPNRIAELMATTKAVTGMEPLFGQEYQDIVTKALVERFLGVSFDAASRIPADQFVNSLFATLFPPETVKETKEKVEKLVEEPFPAATSLADSLFEASRQVREGLIDPMGFTADGLEMMGEELRDFNSFIAQANLIEEMKRIADIAGIKDFDIEPIMEQLLGNMEIAGRNFRDMMSDPLALAELLSSLKTDIKVDQSTRYDIIVRISGDADLDPGRVAVFADALVREIDSRARERGA